MTWEYGKEKFEQYEDNIQRKFDDIKLEFAPQLVLSVRLLTYKKKSQGLQDIFRQKSRTHVTVSCPKVSEEDLREFRTHELEKSTLANGLSQMITDSVLVNQTFQFVIPKDVKPDEEFPLTIEVVEEGFLFNSIVDRKTVDTSILTVDGACSCKTVHFDEDKYELDVCITKTLKSSPDFRFSLGLSDGEKSFRKKRLPHVCKAMRDMFGTEIGPHCPTETPVISLVGSGGGFRASVGMSGVMEALRDAELLDMFTYVTGLSGSSWYLTSSYAFHAATSNSIENFHSELRERLQQTDAFKDMFDPRTYQIYEKRLANRCIKHGQPETFCNYFPGFVIGKQLLGKKMFSKLSEMIPFVEEGKVPYPIIVAIHVKNRITSTDFHAYVERTPHEISYPSYGINIATEDETANWHYGFRVRQCPEYPLHYTVAMAGCSFSVLIGSFLLSGGEMNKKYLNCIEEHRKNSMKPNLETLSDLKEEESGKDHVSEEKSSGGRKNKEKYPKRKQKTVKSITINENVNANLPFSDQLEFAFEDFDVTTLRGEMKQENFSRLSGRTRKVSKKHRNLLSRNFFVGRTVQVNNFVFGMKTPKRFALNPSFSSFQSERHFSVPATAFNVDHPKHDLSTTKHTLGIADAGVLNNTATEIVLRPQRTPDLLIVMDFTAYKSDEEFDYQPLVCAATQAWLSGLEFPDIDFEEIRKTPPKELLIFPSTGPNCPTVLWFTLCNTKFRQLKNYKPRSTAKPTDDRPFNDFKVYDEGTNFGTYQLQYNKYNFDQLRELMYFNVTSHIKEIKTAMTEAIARKQKRLKISPCQSSQ